MSYYYCIAFDSTHRAMAAQSLLCGRFPLQTMPTPRCVTVSCGIALRYEEEALTEALRAALPADSGGRFYRIMEGRAESMSSE